MDVVAAVRGFNRFYTRKIGLLGERLLDSDFSLAEARVLYELAKTEQTAAEIGRTLGMDKAHLSRILSRFRSRELTTSHASKHHGKHQLLSLTDDGQTAYRALDEGTRAQLGELLRPLDGDDARRLIGAMDDIRMILEGAREPARAITLRSLRPGDLGWITHRQAVLYHQEYGWDWTYEGLVSRIFSEFVAGFDPMREDAWLAETGQGILGSIFLMRSDDPGVAKLRLLYVEPHARGLGLGQRLVDTCIARARMLGYRQLTLWTNDVLVGARRIYEAAGFRLVAETSHHSFGQDLIGQTWTLDLTADLSRPDKSHADPNPLLTAAEVFPGRSAKPPLPA